MTDPGLSQMPHRVSLRGGADISPLDVSDHHKILLLAVIHSALECDKTGNPELLIHGNLRLHCRYQIINVIHDLLVELKDRLPGPFQRLSVFCI